MGGSTFDPLALWSGGETGPFYLADRLDSLWQDTGATTPVTAAGQTVRRVDDLSGNGLHATGECVLRQNGSGRYYLEFNGSSHSLQFASMGAGMVRSFGYGGRLRSSAVQVLMEQTTNYNTTAGAFIHYLDSGPWLHFDQRESVGGDTYNSAMAAIGLTSDETIQFDFDRTQATIAGQRRVWRNGTLQTLTPVPTVTNTLMTAAFPAATHYLGARASSSLWTQLDLYGFYGINRVLTSDERNGMQGYIAGLMV